MFIAHAAEPIARSRGAEYSPSAIITLLRSVNHFCAYVSINIWSLRDVNLASNNARTKKGALSLPTPNKHPLVFIAAKRNRVLSFNYTQHPTRYTLITYRSNLKLNR